MVSLQTRLIWFIALLCISSCTAVKPISKKSELTEAEFRAKITPGKTYLFELKSGQKLKVKVTEIDSINLYGVVKTMGEGKKEWVPFKDSYSRLYTNLAKTEEQDSDKSKMFNNSIYGNVGALVFYVNASIYYERMFRKNAQKPNIATFVKVGYGGSEDWGGSEQYFSSQFGILTGVKTHHVEGSLGYLRILGDWGYNSLGGSIGYRKQKPGGRVIFRTGVGWPDGIYLGWGVSF